MSIQETERATFMAYVNAVAASEAGPRASSAAARCACPDEYVAWRAAFIAAYDQDPS